MWVRAVVLLTLPYSILFQFPLPRIDVRLLPSLVSTFVGIRYLLLPAMSVGVLMPTAQNSPYACRLVVDQNLLRLIPYVNAQRDF